MDSPETVTQDIGKILPKTCVKNLKIGTLFYGVHLGPLL